MKKVKNLPSNKTIGKLMWLSVKANPTSPMNIIRLLLIVLSFTLFSLPTQLLGTLVICLCISILSGFWGYIFNHDFSNWFFVGFIVSFIVLNIPYLLGLLIPQTRIRKTSIIINVPVEIVWNVITDYEGKAEWYDLINKTEKISDNPLIWRSHMNYGYIDSLVYNSIPLKELELKTMTNKVKNNSPYDPKEFDDASWSGYNKLSLKSIGNTTKLTSYFLVVENNPEMRFWKSITIFFSRFTKNPVRLRFLRKIKNRAEYLASNSIK